jgi:thiol-disulfide isomerase/thioredoxin
MEACRRDRRAAILLAAAITIAFTPCARGALLREARDGIGRPIAPWRELAWVNSSPLTLAGLRGKVLLVRFWTEGCAYCSHTAPALNALHREYAGRGLVVIGMYHPKPPRSLPAPSEEESARAVARAAERLGMAFPIALDNDWATLRRWWLSTGDRAFTSASFLIDRRGILRAIHPGGEFHEGGGPEHGECRRDYQALRRVIEQLLQE